MRRPGTVAWSGESVKPPMLTHGLLEALPGIRHGFFTREGGVSTGIYRSLNCGVGSKDDRGLVFKNRARAARAIGVAADHLATPYQVHGTDAVDRRARLGAGQGAEGRRRRHQPAGHRRRRRHRRLRPDPLCRPRGARRRRRPCRLARRARRHSRIDHRRDGEPRRQPRRHRRRARTDDLADGTTRSAAELVAAFVADDPANARFFKPGDRPGHSCSTSPATSSPARARPASSPPISALHLCRPGALLFLPPRHPPRRAGLRPPPLRDRPRRRRLSRHSGRRYGTPWHERRQPSPRGGRQSPEAISGRGNHAGGVATPPRFAVGLASANSAIPRAEGWRGESA